MRAGGALLGGLVLGLSLLAGACGSGDSGARPCALIVDATSFAVNTDVPRKIKEGVPRFLTRCDSVAFTVISGAIGQSDCRSGPVELDAGPQDNPNDNPKRAEQIRQARKAFILKTVYDLLNCARAEKSTMTGSDIIGALLDAAQKTAALSGPASLLLISDMAQNTEELNLYKADIATSDSRRLIVERLRRTHRLPKLGGARIEITGFGLHVTPDPVRQQQLKEFWALLFDQSGAQSPSYL